MCIIRNNGSDFAYQDGAYNEYAFTQQENGEVTMKMGKEGYEKPYKKDRIHFCGQIRQKQEPGKKLLHIL